MSGDEAGFLRRFLSCGDRACSGFLLVRVPLVPHRPTLRVVPDRPSMPRVCLTFPDQLIAGGEPVEVSCAPCRGHHIDDMLVYKQGTVPVEMLRQIVGCFGHLRADNEP